MKRLAVSAVNFTEGGPLAVLRDCLAAAVCTLAPDWKVMALVHDPDTVGVAGVEYHAVPAVKASWRRRLLFEFRGSLGLSREFKPDLWLCLHDISAITASPRQAVYCHNPSPFYRPSLREAWHDPAFLLFTLFYGKLYGVNIRRNDWVIVQQDWLREAFAERYGVSRERIIVSHPVSPANAEPRSARVPRVFVYPTLPRPFKNVELIGDAVRLLERDPDWCGEVRVTIDASGGRYARWLVERYGDLRSLHFIGRQDRAGMERLYADADCLIFPSRLETWGLPISEAKAAGLPLIVTDLPYAHETVGDYDRVAFVSVNDSARLASIMRAAVRDEQPFAPARRVAPGAPFAADWPALLRLLTAEAMPLASGAEQCGGERDAYTGD